MKKFQRLWALVLALILVAQMIPANPVARAVSVDSAGTTAASYTSAPGSIPLNKEGYYWDQNNLYYASGDGSAYSTYALSSLNVKLTDLNQVFTVNIGGKNVKLQFAPGTGSTLLAMSTNAQTPTNFTANGGAYTYDNSVKSGDGVLQTYNRPNNISHSGDMLLTQTLKIEALPVSVPTISTPASAVSSTGLCFFMTERSGAYNITMLASIHNTAGGLVLYLADGSTTDTKGTAVALNRRVGQTFTLGTQWNRDESVDVYVDGIYLTTVENVTRTFTAIGGSQVVYKYGNLAGIAKFTISDIVVYKGVPTSLAEEAALNLGDLSAVTGDLTLPTSFNSAYLGAQNIVWSSSDANVISAAGKVTRPDEDTQVTLTAVTADGAALGSFTANVVALKPIAQSDVILAYHTAAPNAIVWNYVNGFAGAIYGGMNAYWDQNNLYIGVMYENAHTLSVYAGSKTATVDLVNKVVSGIAGASVAAANNTAVVTLPLQQLAMEDFDYNKEISFYATLTGANGTAATATALKGKMRFLLQQGSVLYPFAQRINTYAGGSANFDYSKPGVYVYDSAATVTAGNYAFLSGTSASNAIDHSKYDLYLQQTVRIDDMPDESFTYKGLDSNGYLFYLVDRDYDGMPATHCATMLASVVNENGKLMLYVGENSRGFDLGAGLGDTFVLATQWNKDHSVDVYANGRYLGSVQDATIYLSYPGADNLILRYNDLEDVASLTVTDVAVCEGIPASIRAELSQAALLAGVDTEAVLGDISLPTTFESKYVGTISGISWTSSDPDLLNADGKVSRPSGKDATITLTANWKGAPLWSAQITLRRLATVSNTVPAYFTTAAEAAQIDWIYSNGFAGSTGTPAGSLAAAWNASTLYFRSERSDAQQLRLEIAGKSVAVDLKTGAVIEGTLQAVTVHLDGGFVTVSMPLSQVADIAKLDYNSSIDFRATLTNQNGTSATADSGKLSFCLRVEGTYDAGKKVNPGVTTNFGYDALTGEIVFDNAGADSTVTNKAKPNLFGAGTDKTLINHEKNDLLLQQTICVEVMPITAPGFGSAEGSTDSAGLSFWFGDRGPEGYTDVRMALFSLHNTADGLVLYVADGGDSAAAQTGKRINLGRKVGQTFILGTQWNRDDSVDVYVDGLYIGSVKNATRHYKAGQAGYNVYYKYPANQGDTRIVITRAVLGKGIPVSVADELSFYRLFPGVEKDAVRWDLAMPETYESPYLGQLPLNWVISDPTVMEDGGDVIRDPDKDRTVKVTLKVRGDTVWTETLTVKKAFAAHSNTMSTNYIAKPVPTAPGQLSGYEWVYTNAIRGSTDAVFGNMAARWDKNNIYLGMEVTGAKILTLNINGKTFTLDLTTGVCSNDQIVVAQKLGLIELVVPMKTAGIALRDYGQSLCFEVALTAEDGTTASSAKTAGSGRIRFLSSSYPVQYFDLGQKEPELMTEGVKADFQAFYHAVGGVKVGGGSAVFDVKDMESHFLMTRSLGTIDHNKNMLLEQTLLFEQLPVTEATFYGATTPNGYYFYLIDRAINPAAGSSYGRLVYCTIHNTGDGNLVLGVSGGSKENYHAVDLGVKVGQQFTLATQWNGDESFSVYVNGKKLADFENMTFAAYGQGQDILNMGYKGQGETEAKFRISDVSITHVGYTSINQEIHARSVFADQVPTMLEDDITLPTSFESPYLGKIPLKWSSSNPQYLSAGGKVNRPFDVVNGLNVDLTCSIAGYKQMFTVSPLVKTAAVASISLVDAAFSESPIVVDGAITEEGWSMNTNTLTPGGKQTANIGFQWNTERLYIAMDTTNIRSLKLTLNGVDISLGKNGVEAKTAGEVTEIAVPMSLMGYEIKDYGTRIPVKIQVGEGVFEGTIRLSSIDWFSTDSAAHRTKAQLQTSDDVPALGVQMIDNGYYMYDHYDGTEGAINYPTTSVLTHYRFVKKFEGIATVIPLWPVDETYYVSFDFQAASMPVYNASAAAPDIRIGSYGFSFYISGHRFTIDGNSDLVLGGIYNSGENGLMLVISGATSLNVLPLNRHVGDLMRIGLACDPEGDLTVYLDGEVLAEIENVEKPMSGMVSWLDDGCVSLSIKRSAEPAASDADNFDIFVTNFAFGLRYGDELMDSLTFDRIGGLNSNQYWTEEKEMSQVTKDLKLLDSFSNAQLTAPVGLTWSSSNPDIIDPVTGKVTRPDVGGEMVILTATSEAGSVKEFPLYVLGKVARDTYYWVEKDVGAYQGAGQPLDAYTFTLDMTNNSIIYNLKSAQTVNVVKLTDEDTVARLNTQTLELYISDDNVNFTQIKDFKLLHDGRYWYLYDFEATGQYVKVHCTHYDEDEAQMTGLVEGFITAYYEDVFGQGSGSFTNEVTYTLTNEGKDKLDGAFAIPETELGDIFLAQDKADARFYLNGKMLYHYYEDGNFVVRIPEMAAGAKLELTVKSGNANALDISNKEYVHEIMYGVREVWNPYPYYGNRLARLFTFPDGTIIGFDCTSTSNGFAQQYSYDGGRTWTSAEAIPVSLNLLTNMSGTFYDDRIGRLFAYGHDSRVYPYSTHVIYTDDQGVTWQHYRDENGECFCPKQGGSCYVNGLTVSTNDGAGPNVDFVIGMGEAVQDENRVRIGLQGNVYYSVDGGMTWIRSESRMFVDTPRSMRNGQLVENGISENSIIETNNGTLVMYARWQAEDKAHFAVYYSYDHGVTWTEEPIESEVYSVNTNPVFFNYEGTPLLIWAGNNGFGGMSYRRTPLTLASMVDDDTLLDVTNVQDLYSKLFMQGLDTATQNQCTNPSINISHDILMTEWVNNFAAVLMMNIYDFNDFFYKTKGAYDSFEDVTMKYEGWSTSYGLFEISQDQASQGSSSLRFGESSVAGRSFAMLKDGVISMDVYFEHDMATVQLELQTAYSNDEISRTSPVKVVFTDGKFEANGVTLTLHEGWNTVVFDLNLSQSKATISVNGQTANLAGVSYTYNKVTINAESGQRTESVVTENTLDLSYGKYICYTRFQTGENTAMYLDDFLVADNDDVASIQQTAQPERDMEGSILLPILIGGGALIAAAAAVILVLLRKRKA